MNTNGMITTDMMSNMATTTASFGVWARIEIDGGKSRKIGSREAHGCDYLSVLYCSCHRCTNRSVAEDSTLARLAQPGKVSTLMSTLRIYLDFSRLFTQRYSSSPLSPPPSSPSFPSTSSSTLSLGQAGSHIPSSL